MFSREATHFTNSGKYYVSFFQERIEHRDSREYENNQSYRELFSQYPQFRGGAIEKAWDALRASFCRELGMKSLKFREGSDGAGSGGMRYSRSSVHHLRVEGFTKLSRIQYLLKLKGVTSMFGG